MFIFNACSALADRWGVDDRYIAGKVREKDRSRSANNTSSSAMSIKPKDSKTQKPLEDRELRGNCSRASSDGLKLLHGNALASVAATKASRPDQPFPADDCGKTEIPTETFQVEDSDEDHSGCSARADAANPAAVMYSEAAGAGS